MPRRPRAISYLLPGLALAALACQAGARAQPRAYPMDDMRTKRGQQLTKFLASLAFVAFFSVGAGACEDEKDDPLYQDCLSKISMEDSCLNQVFEGCEGCAANCADRGHDVAAQDKHCGKLYAETFACIAALSCDDFLKWYDNNDPKKPFPCQTEETAFRTDCPDFHLYNDNN